MKKDNQHVVPHQGRLAVRGEKADRATAIHNTQAAAIKQARGIAENRGSELYIHGRDGRIRERDSHGRDKYQPKG